MNLSRKLNSTLKDMQFPAAAYMTAPAAGAQLVGASEVGVPIQGA